jgi:hypothetical protein
MGATYAATVSDALLFSQLQPQTVATTSGTVPLQLAPSAITADPRLDWVAGRFGWRYRAWLPDSIYPFVWTVSKRPISFGVPAAATCFVAALDGPWRIYPVRAGVRTETLSPMGSLTALAERACTVRSSAVQNATHLFVVPRGYDAGWRAVRGWSFARPMLANDWMMAWPSENATDRLLYLPAIAQLAGLIAAVVVLGIALVAARRFDERAS